MSQPLVCDLTDEEVRASIASISSEDPTMPAAINEPNLIAQSRAPFDGQIHTGINIPPSLDDVRRALKVLVAYYMDPRNGALDPQDYVNVGKIVERVKLWGMRGTRNGMAQGM